MEIPSDFETILTDNMFSKFDEVLISNDDVEDSFADEVLEEEDVEISDLEMDGLENFGGYIISKLKLDKSFGVRTCESDDNTITYVNLLSEGGLYKPTPEFMQTLKQLNFIFCKTVGQNFIVKKNLLKTLMDCSKTVKVDDKIKERFFKGRIFFKIRFLNQLHKKQCNSKKMKKIIT